MNILGLLFILEGSLCALNLPKSLFKAQSLISGRRAALWSEESDVNPEELGEYLEGDIVQQQGRNGLVAENKQWPDAEVPYAIDGSFSKSELDMIHKAFEEYREKTCINFREKRNDDNDWISVDNLKSGCWSSVGRIGGKQTINLQNSVCFARYGTVIHEFLHVLGFHHEQNRSDRDEYVLIEWNNISKGKETNFRKQGETSVSDFGIEYDYSSVLHYSEMAFSKNQNPTIVKKDQNSKVKIGQREGFSNNDIEKLLRMYKCSSKTIL